jgi:hypothetical protein
MNGDGLDDVIIGAPDISSNNGGYGAAYVVFGTTAPPRQMLLENVAQGYGGIVLGGSAIDARAGFAVAGIGDINGDGFADVIIGEPTSNYNGYDAGGAFVVFGGIEGDTLFSGNLNALGTQGFRIIGEGFLGDYNAIFNAFTGGAVSGAGDVNGDGFDDFIIGAPDFETYGQDYGAAYIIFGGAGVGADVDLNFLGTQGFRISAYSTDTFAGVSVSAGPARFT